MKKKIHEIIYEADTFYGKLFDILLLVLILISLLTVSLESVDALSLKYAKIFFILEWALTFLFSMEYLLRIWSVNRPSKYIFSFYGIIDLLAILPAYLGLFLAGSKYFVVVRAMRLFRVFRVFKLAQFLKEGEAFMQAFRDSRAKITVFLVFIMLIVFMLGTTMYVLEGGEPNTGFTNIPKSIYWAIVTLTTVGYGDISPTTPLGQFIASVIMILGYGVIAVPTGMVSVELSKTSFKEDKVSTQSCVNCSSEGHDYDARYCNHCGTKL